MRKTIIAVILLMLLVAPAYGVLVPYESDMVSDTFEVRKPLSVNPDDVRLVNETETYVVVTNHANNPVTGNLHLTIDAWQIPCYNWVEFDITYKGDTRHLWTGTGATHVHDITAETDFINTYEPGEDEDTLTITNIRNNLGDSISAFVFEIAFFIEEVVP